MSKVLFTLIFITILMSWLLALGTITGVVLDGETGSPITGANITLQGTDKGAAADDIGVYSITSLEAGTFNIVASAIGYNKLRENVTVQDGVITEVNFHLTPGVIELNPVMVLKERSSLLGSSHNFLRIPGSVSVITTRDLERFDDSDINRIIMKIPGVYVQEEDGYGLRPNIGMRGTGVDRSSKINLMEDGIPIAPAPYAAPAAYYSPTAGRMESFEVRKGSSQIKYGPNTTGGALNYISTSIPDQFKVKVNLTGGQFGLSRAHANIGTSSEHYGVLLETYLDGTDGFKELDYGGNTGYDKRDYLAKFRLNTSPDYKLPAALELKYSVTDEISNETYLGLTRSDFDTSPLRRYAASAIDQMDADHRQITITAVIQPWKNFNLTAAYYNNDFDRNWYKLSKIGEIDIGSLFSNLEDYHEMYSLLNAENSNDDTYQIKANNRMYNSNGIQFVAETRFSFGGTRHSVLAGFRQHGDEMDRFQKVDKYKMENRQLVMTTEGIWGSGSKNNRLYEAEATSFFFEDEIQLKNLTLTAGIRSEAILVKRTDWKGENGEWDDPDRVGPKTVKKAEFDVIVPGLGFVYKFNPSFSLLAGIHKGFAPPRPGIEENTTIPEESINVEMGLRYRKGFIHLEAIAFNNQYDNLLGDDTQFAGGGTNDQYNAGEVNIHGLEFVASNTAFVRSFRVPMHMSYTYTKTEFLNKFVSEFEAWDEVRKGYELPYVPTSHLYAQVGLESDIWSANVRFKNISPMRTVAGRGDLEDENSTDRLALIDIAGEYKMNNYVSLSININNVINSIAVVALRPSGLRPTMPRSITASIKFTL